ncbi:SCO family protein [Streptomyces litchfieldiae]|uniref:SCO family protein n=1 Tax=Streptomyces litchfieldiae TaxID=3075543 RepID=A0ABU2MLR4_9ACTN|nr:SCO family protein [Streptomyces sp. DSM 44938]MDT0342059.1 SCO family protein [Streptomyces sp. DSM 44938]
MHLRKISTAAVAAATALTLAACGSENDSGDTGDDPVAEVSGAQAEDEGTVLDQPFDKPELLLTDTNGEPYDFVEETARRATLLYFGYTHCPDICPLTMSNIAVATAGLTEEQRADLRVVFVTTDPERDTPEELGSWLANHDPEFTGLTGDFETIQEAALALGVAIEPSYEDDNGDIVSTHGTQVLAFLPTDDKAHVVYTEGVTAQTFERDLPGLIAGELP